MCNRHGQPRALTTTVPGRGVNINSLQAIASAEETRAEFRAGEVTARVRAPAAPPLSLGVLLRACRPRQWSKNLLVLAAPCAAGVVARPGVAVEVVAAFVVFCMLSSATYLINDVRDREQDRQHPRKRSRPVASGALSSRAAVMIATALALGGLALATAVRPALGAVGCVYLLLTASYTLWWRRVVVADIVAVAAGFLLRAVAGGAATDVFLSRWFLLVTSFCAVFLVAGKRYAELIDGTPAPHRRSTLRHYSSGSLRLLLAAAALSASVAYAAWALTRLHNDLWYELSMAPFVLWLARYAVLLGRGAGEAPEDLILRDRGLLALSAVWGFVFLGSVYAGS
jgi:decaprenyl-phosphate phosphoribosyltransferase